MRWQDSNQVASGHGFEQNTRLAHAPEDTARGQANFVNLAKTVQRVHASQTGRVST